MSLVLIVFLRSIVLYAPNKAKHHRALRALDLATLAGVGGVKFDGVVL